MRTLTILFSCIIFLQCSTDRTIASISPEEEIKLKKFQELDSQNKLSITEPNEPGEKLILCVTFIDKTTKIALSNQQVSFYHASTKGEYEPLVPNDETTSRLNGTAKTDKHGKIYIMTILPGDYGSTKNNRHIHTTVHGAKPEAYDVFFKQYSGRIGNFMNSGNNQMFYTTLKKTVDNILVCFVTIEVKKPIQ
ncbi:MAG: hypothetical protein ABNG98_02570 [Flavobacterium sp.]|jgi:hypothetical protein